MQEIEAFTPLFLLHSHKPFSQVPAASSPCFQVIQMLKKGTRKKPNNCFCFLLTDAMYFLSVLRGLLPEKFTQ